MAPGQATSLQCAVVEGAVCSGGGWGHKGPINRCLMMLGINCWMLAVLLYYCYDTLVFEQAHVVQTLKRLEAITVATC